MTDALDFPRHPPDSHRAACPPSLFARARASARRVSGGSMSRTLCLAGAVLFCGALVLHAQQEPPRPEFRAGTDIVTLDVVVLDKDRKPVRGLTVADFVV